MTKHRFPLAVVLIVAYVVATYLSYSTYIQGDFSIYFQAGERVRKGLDLYSLNDNLYVYGPLLATILSPFTNFDQHLISRIWLLSSIFSTLTASWLFYRTYLIKFGLNALTALTSILIISFSFRNNLGNGNVMAFILLFFVISIRISIGSNSFISSLALALLTLLVFEVKTYIAVFLIAFLVMQKRFLALGLSIFFAIFFNIFYFLTSRSTYLDWLNALKLRAAGVQSGSDQATILVFANRFVSGPLVLSLVVALFLYFLILMALIRFLRNLKSKDSHSGLVLLSAAPILTIFSHGQDYILSAFVLGLVLLQVNLKQNVSRIHQICVPISLGLLVNWTNPSLPQAFLIYTFLIMILRFFLNAKPTLILVSILIFAISTSINAYLHSQGGDIQYLAYNFQALIFGICVFASYVQLESLKSNKAMNS